jgi:hypothetical protein
MVAILSRIKRLQRFPRPSLDVPHEQHVERKQ